MATKDAILSIIEKNIDQQQFRSLHWEGTFDDYLQIVSGCPTWSFTSGSSGTAI